MPLGALQILSALLTPVRHDDRSNQRWSKLLVNIADGISNSRKSKISRASIEPVNSGLKTMIY